MISFVNKKFIKILLLVVWMMLIYFFSSRNAALSTKDSLAVLNFLFRGALNNQTVHLLIRKAAHVFLYFVLGILSLITTKEFTKKELTAAIVLCALYALSDEIHQYFVPGRAMLLSDVLLDSISSCAGILFTELSLRKINGKTASKGKSI